MEVTVGYGQAQAQEVNLAVEDSLFDRLCEGLTAKPLCLVAVCRSRWVIKLWPASSTELKGLSKNFWRGVDDLPGAHDQPKATSPVTGRPTWKINEG